MFDKNINRPKNTIATTTTTTNTAYLYSINNTMRSVNAMDNIRTTLLNRTRSIPTTTTKTTRTAKTTKTTMWVIVQLCLIITLIIQILATLIAPVNCDKQMPSTAAAAPAPASTPESLTRYSRNHNGDKLLLLHRVTRLTHLESNSLVGQQVNITASASGKSGPAATYMASYGLRTRFQPQKFYSQKERSSANAKLRDNFISLNLITEPPKDICQGFCHCERKNAFVTVTCDYQTNSRLSPVFDKSYKVPQNARVIIIKLAPKTQFRLDDGFLNNNTINRFIVQGNMREGEQVEINSNAFSENNGPYPEIGFFNVFAIVIRSKAFQQKGPASYKFNITNSNDVLLLENAFEKTKIRDNLWA